ncbi:hypothetical protein IT575_11880 [bacterium]|nr:hypothetical protein [bacterium]
MSRAELLQEIAALELPGLDVSVAEELRAEFARQVAASSQARWVSTPPRGILNNISDLQLIEGGAGSRSLSWNYRNSGDYDLSGETNIRDLMPIGLYFGRNTASPDWEAARRADGDGNGVVSIADLTPIGTNFLGQVAAYRILGAETAEEPLAELAVLPVSAELLGLSTELRFDLPEGSWQVFAVEPLDASGASGARSNLCGKGIALEQFPGSPGSNLNGSLPQIEFPRSSAEALIEAANGLPLVGNRIGVLFEQGATVADGNALLTLLGAEVIGSDPFTDAVLLQIPQAADTAALASVLEQARGSTGVQLACCDIAGIGTPDTSEIYPGSGENQSSSLRELPPARYSFTHNEFGFTFPDVGYSACYHRWGIENVRAPQAWNLRTYGQRQGEPPEALVIDEFAEFQEDWYGDIDLRDGPGLVFKPVDPNRPPRPYDTHGSQVAEILGANWWNQKKFESINPLQPTLDGVDLDMDGELIATLLNAFSYVFAKGLAQNPRLVVVNNSWGLSKGWANVANAEWMDPLGDLFNEGAARFEQDHRSNFLICSAVGYDGDASGTLIPYDSVFSNVAVRYPGGHYICCELIDDKDKYAGKVSINLGGTVSAPGYEMPFTGTSFSTPMVSSLVSYLWALDPDLTWQQVRTLVTGSGYAVPTTGGTRPRIDAYNAVMGIDALTGTRTMQRAMVDVDDGTPDGQTRINPLSGATVTTIATPDGQRGDGLTTMRDFRAWRDAYLDVESSLSDKLLDGPALHFKRDLNFNGVIGSTLASPPHAYPWSGSDLSPNPGEHIYSRYDFNGDGLLDLNPALVNGLQLTDLDMLADAAIWQLEELDGYNEGVSASADDEGQAAAGSRWQPARYLLANRDAETNAPQALKDLPDYLHSCDLHIDIDFSSFPAEVTALELTVMSELSPDGADNNAKDGVDEEFEVVFDRMATVSRDDSQPQIVTLPLWTGAARIAWEGVGGSASGSQDLSGLMFGEDRAVFVGNLTWHVEALGPPAVSGYIHPSAADINGIPGIVAFDHANSQVLFYLAEDNRATAWKPAVKVRDHSFYAPEPHLRVIGGLPSILIRDLGETLIFQRALDPAGEAWGSDALVLDAEYPILENQLLEINGLPAAAFTTQSEGPSGFRNNIEFARAANAEGSSWLAPVKAVDYEPSAHLGGVAEVDGAPAILYRQSGDSLSSMRYVRATAPDGSTWGPFSILGEDQIPLGLIVADGMPAVAWFASGSDQLLYRRATDTTGGEWGAPVIIDGSASSAAAFALIGGQPAIVYSAANYQEVRYVRSVDAMGSEWPQPSMLHDGFDSLSDMSLDDVGGRPIFGCVDNVTSEPDQLWYGIQR